MSKVKVLFFSADPLSISRNAPRLQLDDEVREIRKRVAAATFGNMLEFDWRLAARTRDLQHALETTRPQIVHFSGHGGSSGLVLAAADGRTPRPVDAEVLRELFKHDAGRIRLVVLTACYSRAQAEAIKEVVGCAIGTRDQISDDASILFNAKFYSAIASGRSVADAFQRARMALRLEFPAEGDILELLHRKDVDPAKIVLVSLRRRFGRAAATTAAAVALSAAVALAIVDPHVSTPLGAVRLGDCTSESSVRSHATSPRSLAVFSLEPESPSEAATDLARGLSFCRARNHDSAFAHFHRAANEGDPEAMAFLGIAYVSGEGTEQDTARGMDWLHRAASKERNARGMNALAIMYENDERMSGRYYRARHWLQNAADKGFADAMRNLGRHYRAGLGVPPNDSLALVWYGRAAHAGSRDAVADIGRMHEEGISGRIDTVAALRSYHAAAAAGSALGMYALGRVYQEAVGVPRDYAKARDWYLRAACAGSLEAMNNLGLLFQHGLGVREDRGEAIGWFRRAAEGGSRAAALNLARLELRVVGKMRSLLGPSEPGPHPACAVPPPPALQVSIF